MQNFAIGQKVVAKVLTGNAAVAIKVVGFENGRIVCENRHGVRGHFTADEIRAV